MICKEQKKVYQKRYRETHGEQIRKYQKSYMRFYRMKNKGKEALYQKYYYEKNRERILERHKRYHETHPWKRKSYGRSYYRAHVADFKRWRQALPDGYIKNLLVAKSNIIRRQDIPQCLIDLKRIQLKVRRVCLKLTTS